MRVNGTTVFPHAMASPPPAIPRSRFEGGSRRKIARLRVQWVFYPDADVNNNPDNPIINIRSFGENPQVVARNVEAFIEGAESDRRVVLTTAKHFPGRGYGHRSPHLGLATITATASISNPRWLVPFRAAIAGRFDSVMTAHVLGSGSGYGGST